MNNISFQYPSWYLVLCLALGLAFALVLYYKDRSFREQSSWLSWVLGTLRFLAVSIIAILLLTPLLKSTATQVKKPVILIAQDGSESIALDMDADARNRYQSSMESLKNSLEEVYDVKTYTFGSTVREELDFNFEDKSTDIAEVLSTAYDLYSNQNLGAVVLASDGIYNEGNNPVYTSAKLSAPVYTVALGDTTPRRDLIVKRVFNNRITYLGDKFSIQVDLLADNAVGNNSQLSIYKVDNGSTSLLQQVPIAINRNDFFSTQELILDAEEAGVQRYRIVFSAIEGEVSTKNNSKDIFIDVLDARQKVLLLAHAPHPDITAFRQSLQANKNYEVSIGYIKDLKENIAAFDFVILHQLPSRISDASSALNIIEKQNIPHLFVVGTQTDIARLNQLQNMVSIRTNGDNTNEVQASVNANFNLFKISEELKSNLSNFAPMIAPFGDFDVSGEGEVLLYQRIGKIDTKYPLWIMSTGQGIKKGVLCAEGIWKWRLFDYLQNQNHDLFDELIAKSIQYLSLKEDKRRFRVNLDQNIFNENEAVYFDAELYNESFELVNEPDVSITLTDASDKEYNYTFTKSGNAYELNAGILPVGDYSYRATTSYNGDNLSFSGQLSVQPIQLESYATTADHNLLRLLSQKFGGALVYPDNIDQIAASIKNQETVKPVIYQSTRTKPVINLKGIFFLLLILLTAEWFLRRYFGAY
jgi:hypothetical protein